MSDRPSEPEARLKTLTRLLNESAGGVEAAAACTRGRVGKTSLSNFQSQQHEQFLPIDVLIRLTQVTGNAELLEEVAAQAGYRLERIGAVSPGCAVRVVAAMQAEATQALQALSDGMADGVRDDADRARIKGELLDVARVATEGAAAMAGGCA